MFESLTIVVRELLITHDLSDSFHEFVAVEFQKKSVESSVSHAGMLDNRRPLEHL